MAERHSTSIPDDVTEAVARKLYDIDYETGREKAFDEVLSSTQDAYRNDARILIETAAFHLGQPVYLNIPEDTGGEIAPSGTWIIPESSEPQIKGAALRDAAQRMQRMAGPWGGAEMWVTDGNNIADLIADLLNGWADEIDPEVAQ